MAIEYIHAQKLHQVGHCIVQSLTCDFTEYSVAIVPLKVRCRFIIARGACVTVFLSFKAATAK